MHTKSKSVTLHDEHVLRFGPSDQPDEMWRSVVGDRVICGLTEKAVARFFLLNVAEFCCQPGQWVNAGEKLCEFNAYDSTVQPVSVEVFALESGLISEINFPLLSNPTPVNTDSCRHGWLVKMHAVSEEYDHEGHESVSPQSCLVAV